MNETTERTATRQCKSPAHRQYVDALETLDVAAGMVVNDLTKARAAAIGFDGPDRVIAVDRWTAEAIERLGWARDRVDEATRILHRHFDAGCRNLGPRASDDA